MLRLLPSLLFLLIFSLSACQGRTDESAVEAPAKDEAEPARSSELSLDTRGDEPLPSYVEFEFPSIIEGKDDSSSWLIRADLSSAGAQEQKLQPLPPEGSATFLGRKGESASLALRISPAEQTLYLTEGLTGFPPEKLILEVTGNIRISAIELEPRALVTPEDEIEIRPVPADPGTILLYRKECWRNPEYELFSWSLFPRILIFDFADYRIQARFFGRLGFFQAVTGESGRIEEEEYYRGRHVYNAHAYSPEDLACFFELARTTGVSLNPQEELLKELAVRNGLLVIRGEEILPGEGAIGSVSRETPDPHIRKRLLTHESAHGLFFAVPAFREGCFQIWADLSERERSFWKLFLGNKGRLDRRRGYDGYDVSNEYLTVNEFQAHVLQLERNEVNSYFRDWYTSRLIELIPEKRELLESLPREDPSVFERTRERLEGLLFRTTGLKHGNLYIVSARCR